MISTYGNDNDNLDSRAPSDNPLIRSNMISTMIMTQME